MNMFNRCRLFTALGALIMLAAIVQPLSADGPVDRTLPGNFGRMFFPLRPFAQPTDDVKAALMELGKPGGILDAQDALEEGPVRLITELELSNNNLNNPTHTAGVTFMGQFLDHDMSFDTLSTLGQFTPPIRTPNSRTPIFDLDSVYGEGPEGSPELYDPNDPVKFLVQSGGRFEDLPRDSANNAIIGDPRNDENLVIAGLHAAFLLFHNNAVDLVRRQDRYILDDDAFAEARRITIYHYQWLILKEFLPRFVGQAMVDNILTGGRRFYTPLYGWPFIPVEFQILYRFGHSMVRPSYRANLAGDNGVPFFAMIFDPSALGQTDPADLQGGFRAPRRFIDWQTFFDFRDGEVKPNKRIDTKISTPLFQLPLGTIPGGTAPISLSQRNLLRHLTWALPSGQTIARRMRIPVLPATDFADLWHIKKSFVTSTPLWFYILREAERTQNGLRLGSVGGRIVGEVFIGLLQTDPNSFLNAQPNWKPTLPTSTGNQTEFNMTDFLTFAGVDPTSRSHAF